MRVSRGNVLAAQVLITLAVAAIWPLCRTLDVPPDATIELLALGLLLLTVWAAVSWRLVGRRLFDPYGMFLLAAVLFNGGQVFLESVGLNANGILGSAFSVETTEETVAMVICAVGALHTGALLAVTGVRPAAAASPATTIAEQLRGCRAVGAALLLVSIVPSVIEMRQRLATVYESGYYALYQGDFATGFEGANGILAGFLVPAVLFQLAGSGSRRGHRRLTLVVVALYVLTYLFSGYRGFAAMLAVAYAWVWHRTVRPLPKGAVLLAVAVTMFVVFPLVAVVRNVSGADRTSVEFLREAYLSIDNPMVQSVSEMGSSMATIAYTLELVPSTRTFEYGLGYLYAISTVFPNLFWDVHPATARGTPSEWLIWTVDPGTARNGGGLGYSFIAEAYLNFGWIGVPLVMVALGYLLCRFVLWADGGSSPSPARIATIATFTAFTLSYARGEASFIVRPLLWYALAPYVAVAVLQKLRAARVPQASRSAVEVS